MRRDGRRPEQLRPLSLTLDFTDMQLYIARGKGS